ncbi:hypothetical protein BJ741DRAFT_659866 [Chytriomyces cf. hyalinus JEL632]|nr:hypothetical protein BJ741DRAFT_659866 [Chytriomyces cf. hyalinus JEL632]
MPQDEPIPKRAQLAQLKLPKTQAMRSMTIPAEVYPIIGMMSVAFGFGTYVVHKQLTAGQDLRLGSRGYNPEHWQTRLNREPDVKQPFGNYFYRHCKD